MGNKLKFPAQLSDAVLMAIKDLRWAEKQPKIQINMAKFQSYDPETEFCECCLAGASVVRIYGPKRMIHWADFDIETQHKLLALEAVRSGNLAHAINQYYDYQRSLMRFLFPLEELGNTVVSYWDSPANFKKYLQRVIVGLRGMGF